MASGNACLKSLMQPTNKVLPPNLARERVGPQLRPFYRAFEQNGTWWSGNNSATILTLYYVSILILDELDHITPSAQTLTSLFSLPAGTPSNIRLIGIANTHTLTSASSSLSLNVQTVHFAPYTSNQLFDILQVRLRSLYDVGLDSAQADPHKFLPIPTLTLLTKKIAGMTGDVRSLFEVLRGAIDIAVAPSKKATVASADFSAVSVTPSHVLAALKAYKPSSAKPAMSASSVPVVSNSETVTKVKNLNLQARIVLLSVLLGSKRLEAGLNLSGSLSSTSSPRKPGAVSLRRSTSSTTQPSMLSMDTNQLHTYYTTILTRSDSNVFDPTSRSEFGDLLNILEGNGLVCFSSSSIGALAGSGRKQFGRTLSFAGTGKNSGAGNVRLVEGVWCDEILRGLGISNVLQEDAQIDICEEEVKAIWQREQARNARDVKANDILPKRSREDVFSDAFEL